MDENNILVYRYERIYTVVSKRAIVYVSI